MAIQPLPVTFHSSPSMHAELLAARRRRAQPDATVLNAVIVLSIAAFGFAYMAGEFTRGPAPDRTASREADEPVKSPDWANRVALDGLPAGPVPSPASSPAPARSRVVRPAVPVDRAPVATIKPPQAPPAPAPAPARSGFASMQRAPDYSGFKVSAGR